MDFPKTTSFDPAKYLDSEEALRAYLNDARSIGDHTEVRKAKAVVRRARRAHAAKLLQVELMGVRKS